jgi:tRNA-dihydrouridine synthase 1
MPTKARQERAAVSALALLAASLPPRPPASSPFWLSLSQAVPGCPSPTRIAAPMVRHSDLPFRMQCRAHGAQLCYTPMLDADKLAACEAGEGGGGTSRGEEQLGRFFATCEGDSPLVAQLGAHCVADFLAAARLLQGAPSAPRVAAVCLNMDCPQRRAQQRGFGAFLMKDRPGSVLEMVREGSRTLAVPVVCKIRLLSLPVSVGNGGLPGMALVSETVKFCKQLEEAGAAMIVVHGRTIDMKNHRSLHPADHEAIGIIRTHVRVPVVANGDIRSMEEHGRCLEKTGADGAMVATELM